MRRLKKFAAGMLAAALLLTACSSPGSSESQDDASSDADQLTIGLMPVAATAALRLGIEQGFFEEQQLEIRIEEAQSGAAISAAVISGEYDLGFSSIAASLQAAGKKLPVMVVSGAAQVSRNQGLLVGPDSKIMTPADLDGARIAVVALKAIDELGVRAAADAKGADSTTLQMLSLPFPEMGGSLKAGRVDAVEVLEPFYSQLIAQGNRVILEDPIADVIGDDGTLSVYFSSQQFVSDHGDAIDRFMVALAKSSEYANSHPDEVVQTISQFTGMAPEAVEKTIPTIYNAEVNVRSVEILADAMVEYEMGSPGLDLSSIIYESE